MRVDVAVETVRGDLHKCDGRRRFGHDPRTCSHVAFDFLVQRLNEAEERLARLKASIDRIGAQR